MRINTLGRKKIFYLILFLFFFGVVTTSYGQCPTVLNPNQSFCDIESPTVGNLIATDNGGGVVWYATASSLTPLSAASGLVNGEDYFADDSSGVCGSRQRVLVSIFSAPIGLSFQGVCVDVASNATLANLVVTGNNIKWYDVPTNGTALPLSTILVDNTIYYASQTNPFTGCETARLSVFVNVGVVPVPTGESSQVFCNDPNNPPTVANLVATGNLRWYSTISSASPLLLSTFLVNGQSYFATTVDPPCESITRFQVDVTLLAPNDSGINGTKRICVSDLATYPAFNLFGELGGSPDLTGVWSGPLSTTNDHLGTVNVNTLTLAGSPYTFTYTVSSAVCATATSTVTIIVLPLPTATIAANTTICSGSNATVTFTGTPNATVTYAINGGSNQTILLNNSGVATLTNSYVANATFTLVSVASATTPSCSKALSGSITITVLPLPTVTIAANTSVCFGGSATVTFTGTPNATVTYTVNGGANQTIVLNASGVAAITNNYNATTVFSLVSIASATAPICTQAQSGAATITVIPVPIVVLSSNVAICLNSSATVTFTGTPNATVTYTVNSGANQTILLNGSGTATITNTYSTTTVYSLVSIATGTVPVCSRPISGTMTVTVLPLPIVTIASSSTICSGASATVTFTGTPNATVTYTINGGANQTLVLNASGTATLVNTYSTTTVISLVSVASSGIPSCSQPQSGTVTITVIPLPIVTIGSSANVCPNGFATVTFTGTPNATITYTVNGGANQTIVLNASGTASITSNYAVTTTYVLVSAASATIPICTQPQTGTITITVIPLPTVTISSNVSVCPNGSATVTFTGTPNAVVSYTINGGANQTITLNASGTATIVNTYATTTVFALVSAATSGSPSCSQPQSGTMTVTVKPLPVVTIAANTDICVGASATVTFTGTPNATVTYTVNGGANQTIVLNAAGIATITNTYAATTVFSLVSVASAGLPSCSQPQSGTITITVLPIPTVTISSDTTLCSGGSATVTFTGTPNSVVTYTINGGANQTIVLNGSGTATITNSYSVTTVFSLVSVATAGSPGCIVPKSGTVTITVVPLPLVTISSNTTICSGASATVTFTGTPNATVTYTINGGSNQTIVLNGTGSATLTNTYVADAIFTLVSATTSGTPTCTQPQSGTITITVLPLPVVAIASSSTICSGSSATVTFTGTPNATVTYTINGGVNQTILLNASGTASVTNTYAATTNFTLISVATSGTPGCSQPQSGTVTITVLPPPVVTLSTNVSVCIGSSATVTFTGTPNATVTYTVNGGPNQTIILNAVGTATITDTYVTTTIYTLLSVALTGTPSCSQLQSGTMTVTVITLPTVTIAADATICLGSSATVTFTGTPNATVTYTVNSGANQTLLLSGTGTATISGSYNTTTVFSLVNIATSGTPSCSQSQSGTVTITVVPLPVVAISSDATICSGENATVTFTGTPNATVTYVVNGGANQTIVLDANGLATVTNSYSTTTVFSLLSVTSAGTPTCTQPQSGTVTITVTPLPTVTLSPNTTVCMGTSATVTFTGTPNATVTYTINGGGNQTIVLNAAGTATLTAIFNATTTYTLVSVASFGIPSCSQPQTGTMVVTVDPLPTVTIVSDVTICSGSPATVTFTGTPNAIVTYTLNGGAPQTITIDNSGTVPLTNTYTLTSVISLVSITTSGTPGCSQLQSGTVTITVLPLPTATISVDAQVCLGSNAAVVFSGTPNATVTYTVNFGANQNITLDATGSATLNTTLATTTTYTLVSVVATGTPSCVQLLPEFTIKTVTVVPLPTATISASNATICSGSSASVTFTGTPNSTVTYTINSGSNLTALIDATGIITINIPLVATSTITLVSSILTNPPSCSQPLTGSVTITVTQPPIAGSNANLSICSDGTPQDLFLLLGGSAQPGGTWLPVLASGTGFFNPVLDAVGAYVYTVAGTPPCVNDTAMVMVSVVPSANAGTDGVANLCSNLDPVNLVSYLGGTPQAGGTWNPPLASATNSFDPSVDAAGAYIYTVNGVAPCGNDAATVTVNITVGPNAGVSASTTLCLNSPVQHLFPVLGPTADAGGVWSPALASGTDLFDPALDAPGPYVYTFSGNQTCDNDTATITVIVNPLPNAGDDAPAIICSNTNPVNLLTYLGGTPQTGGTWLPPLHSGTDIFDPTFDTASSYTYTIGNPFCTPDIATLTITIIQGPEAGVSASTELCVNSLPIHLFPLLGATAQVGGTWSPPLASTTDLFDPALDAPGPYLYTLSGNQPCDNDTASVTVTVTPLPNAGTFLGNQNVCPSEGTFDLFSLLNGNQIDGVWTDSANLTVTNTVEVTTLAAASYSYTYTITNTCGVDSETVQFSVFPNPVLAAANIAVSSPNCTGQNVVVTFTNMVDGTYTLNYNLSLSNVLTNQNVNVVITGGTGTFAIIPADIPNIGTTRITFLNITNVTSTCTVPINPNISADFILKPSANLESTNLSVANLCAGTNATVFISGATGLADGNYLFAYSLPQAVPATGVTNTVAIASGVGQFTVPALYFTTAGNYTVTITSITSLSSGCNNLTENANTSFVVYPIPDTTGGTLNAATSCLNYSNDVALTNASNIIDGTYTITYQLSGAASATTTATITVTGGTAIFTIPAADLTTAGNVTVTVTQFVSQTGLCSATTIGITPVTFEVSQLSSPVLNLNGEKFCATSVPTIASLTSNVSGNETVTWYDALNGGTAYSSSDLLVDGTIYYGAIVSASGCESLVRLPVTVDLNQCDAIEIPDGFSPNDDGNNDFFVIKNIRDRYPNFTIEIYNRYGNILYKGNRNIQDWDGTTTASGITIGNSVLPVGVYFYILEFNDGVRKSKQGRLYLSR